VKTFLAETPEIWRQWLARHHKTESEIWLMFFKRHTGAAVAKIVASSPRGAG